MPRIISIFEVTWSVWVGLLIILVNFWSYMLHVMILTWEVWFLSSNFSCLVDSLFLFFYWSSNNDWNYHLLGGPMSNANISKCSVDGFFYHILPELPIAASAFCTSHGACWLIFNPDMCKKELIKEGGHVLWPTLSVYSKLITPFACSRIYLAFQLYMEILMYSLFTNHQSKILISISCGIWIYILKQVVFSCTSRFKHEKLKLVGTSFTWWSSGNRGYKNVDHLETMSSWWFLLTKWFRNHTLILVWNLG